MPYFVFRFGPIGIPELLGQDAVYKAARARMAAARAQSVGATDERVRMVFAANEIEAIDLLTSPRAPDASSAAEDD